MVDFDKFEKLVKQKYGEQEFEFDEANWDKARQMIDASRKGKNRGGIWLLSSAAVLLTTGLVYYFVFSKGSDAINSKVVVNEPSQNKEIVRNAGPFAQKQEENPSANNLSSENPIGAGNVSNSITNSASSEDKHESVSKNSSIPDTNHSGSNSNNTPNHPVSESSVKNNTESHAMNKETKKSGSSSESQSGENTAKSNNKKSETTNTGKKNSIPTVLGGSSNNTQNPKSGHAVVNSNSSTGNTNKTGEITGTNSSGSVTITKTGNGNDNTITPVATDSSEAVVTVGVKPASDAINTMLNDSTESIKQIPADSFKLPPPAVSGEGTSYATNVKLEHEHKNFLFMEAGGAYLLGWNGAGHEADGFNVVAGLNFQHHFTSNISAQIGVQYNTINNLSNSTHTISTKNYDFGLQQDVTTISYTKLHYAVVPVKFGLTVRKHNVIGVGCNIGYLLNSDSRKENYTTTNNSGAKNNLRSSKEKGYVQGFNPLDIQASVFYRRKIYKGFGVNAEFIYGLTDVKDNSFFKTNSFDRNAGFKLTLCYDLFKK